ncbi:MAG: hypothetical protein EPN74_00295 [Rhodanobacter sp.]|nr:MAG: hypothetical protein EPN74_00295 [Rhodanobacter sp.]
MLLAPLTLSAQQTRGDYLRRFDRNGDGRVSMAEYVSHMSRGFQRMDRNGDGILELSELPGRRGKPVTRAAFENRLRRQFRKLDRNHDGFLSARELTAPPR